jgi:hypothetical protein
MTLCAECSALLQSVAVGDFQIEAIAVVGGPREVATVSCVDVRVLSANADLSRILVRPISALLPHGSGPRALQKEDERS